MDRSSGPLASSWAKWRRAKIHLDALNAISRQRVEGDPEAFVRIDKTFDKQAGCFVFHVVEVRVTDDDRRDWGTMFGDCLNNLRGALDHLAWYLVSIGSRFTALNNEQQVKVQFPIDAEGDDEKFIARCETRLPGVDSVHLDICRSYQPHKTHNPTLATLADLVGKDKHRVVTPILVRNNYRTFSIVVGSLVNCTYKSMQPVPGLDRLEPDTPLVLVFVEPTGTGEPDVKMSIEMICGLALQQGLMVNDFLSATVALAEAILDDFERVL